MRVAPDTNVLVSAYTTRGLSADVLRAMLAEHDLVLPGMVLDEFTRVMTGKFQMPVELVDSFTRELLLHGVRQTDVLDVTSFAFIPDPDDRTVVATAISGGAEFLVTGDRDILGVRDRIDDLEVLTPREFWQAMRARRG